MSAKSCFVSFAKLQEIYPNTGRKPITLLKINSMDIVLEILPNFIKRYSIK